MESQFHKTIDIKKQMIKKQTKRKKKISDLFILNLKLPKKKK